MMTGTELFTRAHAIARETRAAFITYRAAFSAALKGVYASMKNEKSTAEKLEDLGFSAWERGDKKRYYIKAKYLEQVFDVVVKPGKYGPKVYVEGKITPLTKVAQISNGNDIYYDAIADAWMQGRSEIDARIVDAIRI